MSNFNSINFNEVTLISIEKRPYKIGRFFIGTSGIALLLTHLTANAGVRARIRRGDLWGKNPSDVYWEMFQVIGIFCGLFLLTIWLFLKFRHRNRYAVRITMKTGDAFDCALSSGEIFMDQLTASRHQALLVAKMKEAQQASLVKKVAVGAALDVALQTAVGGVLEGTLPDAKEVAVELAENFADGYVREQAKKKH